MRGLCFMKFIFRIYFEIWDFINVEGDGGCVFIWWYFLYFGLYCVDLCNWEREREWGSKYFMFDFWMWYGFYIFIFLGYVGDVLELVLVESFELIRGFVLMLCSCVIMWELDCIGVI